MVWEKSRGRFILAALLIGVLETARADSPTIVREEAFVLASPAEVIAQVRAGCAGCSWATPGREAAALRLEVDGRYSQHLLLTRGDRGAEYRVALGRLEGTVPREAVSYTIRTTISTTR